VDAPCDVDSVAPTAPPQAVMAMASSEAMQDGFMRILWDVTLQDLHTNANNGAHGIQVS
jgi:hypothetical protein